MAEFLKSVVETAFDKRNCDHDYPRAAGHRGIDTSIVAADIINKKLPKLQSAVAEALLAAGPAGLTADEIAVTLGWDRHRVRPRTSELRRLGRIGDSGLRRSSDMGVASIVWVAREYLIVR
jgi:hypothetical protein